MYETLIQTNNYLTSDYRKYLKELYDNEKDIFANETISDKNKLLQCLNPNTEKTKINKNIMYRIEGYVWENFLDGKEVHSVIFN